MRKKLHLISLGCNKNLIDSEIMLGRLKQYDICDKSEEADLIIINTCGFIDAAKKESLQNIFSVHEKRKKSSLLVVAGCLIERYKEELVKQLPEVDLFTGVGNFNEIDEIIKKKENRFSPKVYLQHDEERIPTGSNVHAYIKLSEGCNQKCSFCAIPNFKGKLQSRSLEEVLKEVKSFVEKGYYDFSFISQDSSSYMYDLKNRNGLFDLICEVEKIKGVKSARILYLYPTTLSFKLIKKINESKIFHSYFDMPIQHINDKMLSLMKRGSKSQLIKKQFKAMKKAFLRTSIIVGHPGEGEKEFEEMCGFLEEFPIDRLSIFAYSDEEGTKSFEMKDKISEKIISSRIEKLEKIAQKQRQDSLKKDVGKHIKIVLEGISSEGEFFLSGRKLEWAPEIDGEILINESLVHETKQGKIYEALVKELVGDKLVACITREIY